MGVEKQLYLEGFEQPGPSAFELVGRFMRYFGDFNPVDEIVLRGASSELWETRVVPTLRSFVDKIRDVVGRVRRLN